MVQTKITYNEYSGMNEKELDAYRKRIEEVAYQAVIKIGEYCTMRTDNDFCLTDTARDYHEWKDGEPSTERIYVGDGLKELCDSDYVIFGAGWESSKECRAFHAVAEELGITILEVDA